jgi:outer membrane protein assembly factor BamD
MKNQGVIKKDLQAPDSGGFRAIVAALGTALMVACASTPPSEEIPSAETYYRQGLETLEGRRVFLFFRDVDYARAIEMFQEVIDNYPYSDYATLAELKIADVYFEQERYEEAAGYFQDFVELHPSHPQVPYAIYQRGLCSFERMRAPDQDPGPTDEAIAQFSVLLERYPTSEYAEDGKEKLREAENRMAEYSIGVGDFYVDRGQYYAAAERYRETLDSYPNHREHQRTQYRLALALRNMGHKREASRLLVHLLSSQPDEDLAEEAEDALRDLNGAAE